MTILCCIWCGAVNAATNRVCFRCLFILPNPASSVAATPQEHP